MEKVYILGGAQTDFERNWTKEGKNVFAMLREVTETAFQQTDIPFEVVSELNRENKVGLFVGNFLAEDFIKQSHLGGLLTEINKVFYGIPSVRCEAACASGSVAIDMGATKIRSGEFDLSIVVGFEMMKTVNAEQGSQYIGKAALYETEAKDIPFAFPGIFSQLGDIFIKKYNLDEQQYMDALAYIANNNYENAKRNPNAQTRNWFMDLKQAKSRGTATNPYIKGRIAKSDCSQITDGAVMIMLASERFVRKYGKERYPVIKGYAQRTAPFSFEKKIMESAGNEYVLPWTRKTVEEAYRKAGMNVKDIDFFETHDCFTPSEYAAISAFGITAPGQEYQAILDGTVLWGGKKPINPSGGLIGCGHPIGGTGVRMMLDLYKQVTGNASTYQVEGARNGMMLNLGGTATTNFAFIVGVEN